MKNLVLALLLGVSVPSFAGTLEQLNRIAELAGEYIGNGDTDTGRYVVSRFNKAKAIKELSKRKFEGCTWTTLQDRRETIAAIKTDAGATEAAEELMKMYDQKRLKAAFAIQSDNDISCSRLYVEVYTNDGYKLFLNFDSSD